MRPDKAWASALGQLQFEMPKAAFENWIKNTELVSYDDGVFTISAPNAYAREWLESRLSSTMTRLLTGIMNQSVEIDFTVQADDHDHVDDGVLPKQSSVPNIQVQIDYHSLRDAITQPHKIVVIPGYFRRWIPFLGPTPAWIIVAFRQMMYLSTGKEATTNSHFSTSPQQVAKWAGIDRTTLWRNMKNHHLRWFLKRADEKQHIYEFLATMPLTPGDAQRLHDWLVDAGASSDPVAALNAALEAPVETIWPSPSPLPEKEHLEMEPKPRGVQAVVLDACGNIKADIFDEVTTMADQLAIHLMPPQDLIVISHYFLKNWIQQLGAGPAWLITLLRDECYLGKDEIRNSVWVQGGNTKIARMLGLKQRGAITISEWLPPLPDSQFERKLREPTTKDPQKIKAYQERVRRREAKRTLIGLFLNRSNHQDGVNGTAWEFQISLLEPLTPEHQAQYDFTTGIIKDFFETDELTMLKNLLGNYAYATSDYADAADDYAIATVSRESISRMQQAITRLQSNGNAIAANNYADETEQLRVRDALNTLNHFKLPVRKLIENLNGKNSINLTTVDTWQNSDQNDFSGTLVVEELSEEWDLNNLLATSQLHPGTREKLKKLNIEPWILISHMLYAHSQNAINVKDPMAIVGSAILKDPSRGYGDPYDILAQMAPRELASLIEQAYEFSVKNPYDFNWRSGNQAWDGAIAKTAPERLLSLATRLGIVKV
jgi:hypothetical protein